MAWTAPKTWTGGERLYASDLNTYVSDNLADLDPRTVKTFADASARTSGISSPTEGMMSYLADTDAVEVYDGSAWTALGGGGFTASTAITATDASWTVPTLADPVVRVTVVAGGGGGGSGGTSSGAASAGSNSSFACSAGTVTASGGVAGIAINSNGPAGTDYFSSGNGGGGAEGFTGTYTRTGSSGMGGQTTVAYLDMTGVTTANVTVGAGGAGGTGTSTGGAGGDGVVIFEYRAG